MKQVASTEPYLKRLWLKRQRSVVEERSLKTGSQLLFFTNSDCGKEAPIVIGRHQKPRCFKVHKNIKQAAGVLYYSNTKLWMNTDIMNNVLLTLS